MNCDHSIIVRLLHSMGKIQKSDVWVPHALNQNGKNRRLVIICAALLAHHPLAHEQYRSFLSCIDTGDEKWCLYVNIRKRNEWMGPNKKAAPCTKTCMHPQKIMLCIWWNSKSLLYNKLLPRSVTITADIYCQRLRHLADVIQEKQPTRLHEVMLLHDNAPPHSANLTKNTIQELGWEVILHPPYSLDLAPLRFSTFPFKELPFQMKMCSEGLTTSSTQNHASN